MNILSCYRTVPSAIWEIWESFLPFSPKGWWNNSKKLITRKIFVNIARGNNCFIVLIPIEIKCSKNCLTYLLTASSLLNIIHKYVKTASTKLTRVFFFLYILIRIFCTLFILYSMVLCNWLVFECFVQKIQLFFKNTYLLSYWFHCVDIFYMKFKSFNVFTVINSLTKTLLIEILHKFRTVSTNQIADILHFNDKH